MALVIGDPALLTDHVAAGLQVDLGEHWTEMTGLPFVRRSGRAGRAFCRATRSRPSWTLAMRALPRPTDRGAYCGPELADLRVAFEENILRARRAGEAGLRRFYELAEKHRIIEAGIPPSFYRA
jgi:hypothetical protein